MSIINEQDENASQLCQRLISHYEAKADHNKAEALRCFMLVIICTLITPLFITLGSGLWLGKVVPSVLSLIAAGATAWLQQRKPQQLWSLYRTAQRELEVHKMRHRYLMDEYETATNPDKLLARNVAVVVHNTHQQWVPVVPSPDNLKLMEGGSK
ncbi:MAG TPA: DUF4231 domain-containing protein [Pyrinomonadaceae bacterium]|nr:DUF4231 domain-containing protein [Pyrinomonadaceae bacterium]